MDRAVELGPPDVLDPSTAKPIGTVAPGDTADVDRAVSFTLRAPGRGELCPLKNLFHLNVSVVV
ncbi:hypothetical protein ACL02T_34345 [Pseudonocardia sp. RS010]|uniref:hypothetical protein n=1 Tax=Pseudonocardia sp. RS010 TaxID=3385979 RepID=UPI0039A14CEE